MFSKKNNKPQQVDVLDKPFTCLVCKHDLFYQGKAQLNTRLATLINLDWANKTATYLTCAHCGHMSWFNQ